MSFLSLPDPIFFPTIHAHFLIPREYITDFMVSPLKYVSKLLLCMQVFKTYKEVYIYIHIHTQVHTCTHTSECTHTHHGKVKLF